MDNVTGPIPPLPPLAPISPQVEDTKKPEIIKSETVEASQVIEGEVVAIHDDGEANVKTAIGTLLLKVNIPLKPKDTLTLALVFTKDQTSMRLLTLNGHSPLPETTPRHSVPIGSATLPPSPHHQPPTHIGSARLPQPLSPQLERLDVYAEKKLDAHIITDHVDPIAPTVHPHDTIRVQVKEIIPKALQQHWKSLGEHRLLPEMTDHHGKPCTALPNRPPLLTRYSTLEWQVMEVIDHPPTVLDLDPDTALLALNIEKPPTPHGASASESTPSAQKPTALYIKATPLYDHDTKEGLLLETPIGTMQAKISLPPNTTLLLKLTHVMLSDPKQIISALHEMKPLATMNQLQHGWQTVSDLLSSLLNHRFSEWSQLKTGVVMDARKLLPELSLYLSLVQHQKLDTVLHDHLQPLLHDYPDHNTATAEALVQEARVMTEQFAATTLTHSSTHYVQQDNTASPSGWKLLILPFYHYGHYMQSNLYVRDDHIGGSTASDKKRIIRFVLESYSLTLGALQLDGLVEQPLHPDSTASLRFDLILRSEAPLEDVLHQELLSIFHDVLTSTKMQGALLFEPGYPFPIEPADEYAPSPVNSVSS